MMKHESVRKFQCVYRDKMKLRDEAPEAHSFTTELSPPAGVAPLSPSVLSRPMQRKLVTLVNCQLVEEEGRVRAVRAGRSLGERTVTELILQHQNPQQLSANLWAAVRARGCQFLGPGGCSCHTVHTHVCVMSRTARSVLKNEVSSNSKQQFTFPRLFDCVWTQRHLFVKLLLDSGSCNDFSRFAV